MIKDWNEVLWSNEDASIDAYLVCYAIELMGYTDGELSDVLAGFDGEPPNRHLGAEQERRRRLDS